MLVGKLEGSKTQYAKQIEAAGGTICAPVDAR